MLVRSKEDVKAPFLAALGEVIYELVGSDAEVGGTTRHSVAVVSVPTGKLSPRHYHRVCEETYFILKGTARMVIDEQPLTLTTGQSCLIMPGEVHQVFNDADEPLEFLVVCAPPWTPSDVFEV